MKCDRAGPRADLHGFHDFLRGKVGDEDRAVRFRRDPDALAAGLDGHTFRFIADLEALNEMAVAGVDDAELPDVFIGDVRSPFRQGSPQPAPDPDPTEASLINLRWRQVDDADAIGAAIGRRQLRFVRRSDPPIGEPLSATYSSVRSGLAAMPRGRLPSGMVATTVLRGGVDDGEIAARLIGNVNADGGRRRRRCDGSRCRIRFHRRRLGAVASRRPRRKADDPTRFITDLDVRTTVS